MSLNNLNSRNGFSLLEHESVTKVPLSQDLTPEIVQYNEDLMNYQKYDYSEKKITINGINYGQRNEFVKFQIYCDGFTDPDNLILSFEVANPNTSNCIQVDGSCHSFIKSLKFQHLGQVIEEISDYNIIMSIMNDFTFKESLYNENVIEDDDYTIGSKELLFYPDKKGQISVFNPLKTKNELSQEKTVKNGMLDFTRAKSRKIEVKLFSYIFGKCEKKYKLVPMFLFQGLEIIVEINDYACFVPVFNCEVQQLTFADVGFTKQLQVQEVEKCFDFVSKSLESNDTGVLGKVQLKNGEIEYIREVPRQSIYSEKGDQTSMPTNRLLNGYKGQASYGVKEAYQISGDGKCGYRCLAFIIKGNEDLWQDVCDEIIKAFETVETVYGDYCISGDDILNPVKFSQASKEIKQQKIKNMKSNTNNRSGWCTDEDMILYTKISKINIMRFQRQENGQVAAEFFFGGDDKAITGGIYMNLNHYEVVTLGYMLSSVGDMFNVENIWRFCSNSMFDDDESKEWEHLHAKKENVKKIMGEQSDYNYEHNILSIYKPCKINPLIDITNNFWPFMKPVSGNIGKVVDIKYLVDSLRPYIFSRERNYLIVPRIINIDEQISELSKGLFSLRLLNLNDGQNLMTGCMFKLHEIMKKRDEVKSDNVEFLFNEHWIDKGHKQDIKPLANAGATAGIGKVIKYATVLSLMNAFASSDVTKQESVASNTQFADRITSHWQEADGGYSDRYKMKYNYETGIKIGDITWKGEIFQSLPNTCSAGTWNQSISKGFEIFGKYGKSFAGYFRYDMDSVLAREDYENLTKIVTGYSQASTDSENVAEIMKVFSGQVILDSQQGEVFFLDAAQYKRGQGIVSGSTFYSVNDTTVDLLGYNSSKQLVTQSYKIICTRPVLGGHGIALKVQMLQRSEKFISRAKASFENFMKELVNRGMVFGDKLISDLTQMSVLVSSNPQTKGPFSTELVKILDLMIIEKENNYISKQTNNLVNVSFEKLNSLYKFFCETGDARNIVPSFDEQVQVKKISRSIFDNNYESKVAKNNIKDDTKSSFTTFKKKVTNLRKDDEENTIMNDDIGTILNEELVEEKNVDSKIQEYGYNGLALVSLVAGAGIYKKYLQSIDSVTPEVQVTYSRGYICNINESEYKVNEKVVTIVSSNESMRDSPDKLTAVCYEHVKDLCGEKFVYMDFTTYEDNYAVFTQAQNYTQARLLATKSNNLLMYEVNDGISVNVEIYGKDARSIMLDKSKTLSSQENFTVVKEQLFEELRELSLNKHEHSSTDFQKLDKLIGEARKRYDHVTRTYQIKNLTLKLSVVKFYDEKLYRHFSSNGFTVQYKCLEIVSRSLFDYKPPSEIMLSLKGDHLHNVYLFYTNTDYKFYPTARQNSRYSRLVKRIAGKVNGIKYPESDLLINNAINHGNEMQVQELGKSSYYSRSLLNEYNIALDVNTCSYVTRKLQGHACKLLQDDDDQDGVKLQATNDRNYEIMSKSIMSINFDEFSKKLNTEYDLRFRFLALEIESDLLARDYDNYPIYEQFVLTETSKSTTITGSGRVAGQALKNNMGTLVYNGLK